VTLARMEGKGFVESHQEERAEGSIGLPRRLYTPTPYGLKVRDAYRLLRDALALKPVEVR
jgi:DNA-binding PadR family transcriptional regulator